MKRQILELCSATKLASRPNFIPIGRPRGAKAFGLRYERAFGKNLPAKAEIGPWFEYVDKRGEGWCQADAMLELGKGLVVVFECKTTWTAVGHLELETLYCPVVEMALGKKAIGVQVCKMLEGEMPRVKVVRSLEELTPAVAVSRERLVLHWLGKGVLRV